MPKPTYEQLKKLFPRGTESFLRANSEPSRAQPEPAFRNEPLGAAQGEESYPTRFSIRLVSFRTRLCDPDNLAGKFFVDAIRYEELVPDDTAEIVDYHISQRKVKTKQEERTEITITPL